jgi:hypothetical protein
MLLNSELETLLVRIISDAGRRGVPTGISWCRWWAGRRSAPPTPSPCLFSKVMLKGTVDSNEI